MVLHNVYFWTKPEVDASQMAEFEKGTRTFLEAVPEIKRFEIGKPSSTPKREVVDKSFALSIFVWFDSVEDHDIYQTHPAHKVFIDSFNGLWEEVKVLDSDT